MAEKRQLKAPTGAILSKYLRALALDVETTDENGDLITKAEALAKLVWKHALGFEQSDPDVGKKKIQVAPAVWAIDLLYSRIEGKIPLAVIEDQGRSLTEKVSDLGKAKANSLAQQAADAEEAGE